MVVYIFVIILGIILVAFGVLNLKGNISSLHSYHRDRVAKEDVKPFGKLVGIGTIIIATSLIIMGAFSLVTYYTSIKAFIIAGEITLGVGLVIGLIIMFYAIKKYNKGIF